MENIKIGVDIGGSHITAGLVNLEDGTLIKESLVRRNINSAASSDIIINEWAITISHLIDNGLGFQVEDVCIAMPGPFDYNKGISLMQNQNKYDALYGLNVKELLAEKLNLPVKNIVMKN